MWLGFSLLAAGLVLWFGNQTGLFPTFHYAGYVVGTVGALLTATGIRREHQLRDNQMRATLSPEAYGQAKEIDRLAAVAALHGCEMNERRLRRIAAPVCLLGFTAIPASMFIREFGSWPYIVAFMAFAMPLGLWVSSRGESEKIRLRLAALGEVSADATDVGLARAVRRERIAIAIGIVSALIAAIAWFLDRQSIFVIGPCVLLAAISIERWWSLRGDTARIRNERQTAMAARKPPHAGP